MEFVAFVVLMVFLALVGGYIVTSLLLLRFPSLIHKKKNLKFRCRHISHRGGAGENLENTMAAFKHALSLNTEMLELDCHVTRDGQVVVSHDESLERACGYSGKISGMDYKDLPPLKPCLNVDFSCCHEIQGGEDRQIPLLRDVFEAFPNLAINIDIKVDDDELITKVSDLVREYKRESLTGWGNRSDKVETKLHKQNPDIPLIFSMRRVVLLLFYFYSGLLPFIPLKESLFEVIMPSILLDEGKSPMKLSKKQRFAIRVVDALMMRPLLFKHLERRGIQTYLWVLNTEDEFERAFKLGVHGVMTDFPTKLTEFLDANPQYRK
ncbi:lysophospholipase D GDPD1-like [Haliotis cracherodii]|uniref:lysophospholipase D GDPD1-like n=1 Tax=Haliotis cracherodii TaxID=6455 RepID=UPI0039EA1ADF